MKTFKHIDVSLSSLLILLFIIWQCIAPSFEMLILSYTITGAWQLISMLIHAINKCFTRRWGTRYNYHWIAFISVITIPIGSVWILAVLSPFMALFYTGLCYNEIRAERASMNSSIN